MAKAKGGGGAKGGKDSAAVKKCICDDPFKCSCGNRPERPSRGHKWYPDEQIWGGKGHKQKGGSGQVSSIAKDAVVTEKGKTKVEMWQRLPSQLLEEYCKKHKRPSAKFKNMVETNSTSDKMYKFRVIVPDPSDDRKKDLFFVSANSVPNEEQAMEEGCLLALLHLTPTIPHERKLPEPYRTTWLNAIQSSKQKQQQSKTEPLPEPPAGQTKKQQTSNNNNRNKVDPTQEMTQVVPAAAQASSILQLATSYTSLASKQKQNEEIRKQQNERIRKHEAIRMANQYHQVFMSAQIRRQIEQLLRRGEGDNSTTVTNTTIDDEYDDNVDNDYDNDNDNENPADDLDSNEKNYNDGKMYVEGRLYSEGFTKKQAKAAYREYINTNVSVGKAEEWDKIYEECLQWLLVHLNEDQLPEGFDPRGRTLDVIAPPTVPPLPSTVSTTGNNGGGAGGSVDSSYVRKKDVDSVSSEQQIQFASRYGISNREAKLIFEKAKFSSKSEVEILWDALLEVSNVTIPSTNHHTTSDSTAMKYMLQEELEALEAIYGSCFKIVQNSSNASTKKTTVINITFDDDNSLLTLEVTLQDDIYPAGPPSRVLISGKWPTMMSQTSIGVYVHKEMIKFLTQHPLEEPMIFNLCSFISDTVHSFDEVQDDHSLIHTLAGLEKQSTIIEVGSVCTKTKNGTNLNGQVEDTNGVKNEVPSPVPKNQFHTRVHRPKENRKTFWNILPKDTPPAQSLPSISVTLQKTRMSLPAATSRQDFLDAMKQAEKSGSRVLLVTGETGSGKSTQLPAFLLENDPVGSKIVVAQPRRIAATGVASRVAEERGETKPGTGSVGYVVRGDSALCDKTRLVFCTTGVLLRQLQNEGALRCITHIVVDEVHERGLDSDVLLGLLKQYLPSNPHLKLVLMSATLDTNRFVKYFDGDTPHIHIPGRTFPVTDFTLEDVLSITGYVPPKNPRKGKQQRNSRSTSFVDPDEEGSRDNAASLSKPSGNAPPPVDELIKRVDETNLDYDLIACLVKTLINQKDPDDDGSILVFLPGVAEINELLETIKRYTKGMLLLLLPLHGGLQPKEQSRVFPKPGIGCTKVILSTNVAETSVTIPDCTVVIDSAREKQSSYDPVNRMPMLVDKFASKASLQQRRGRAGRVRPGLCYKLISSNTLAGLTNHTEPEIRRVALDQTLLQLMFLGVENGSGNFMKTLLDPPSYEALAAASFSLRKLGAIDKVETTLETESALTPLGVHLAGIPAPPVVGKMLVMGSILGCRNTALSMAAGISLGRSPLIRIDTFRKRDSQQTDQDEAAAIEEMKQKRLLEDRASYCKIVDNSDHALLALLYSKWKSAQTFTLRKTFCDSVGLNFNVMRDIDQLVGQLDSALISAGFPDSKESDCNASSWRIVHACAISAMSPSQLVKVERPAAKYTETAEGAMEKDGEARELKFFIRTENITSTIDTCISGTAKFKEERVFIHPSSINFTNGTYSCPFLVYNALVTTSKPFLRDVTECNPYALLLFGGSMDVQASKGVLVIDEWAHFSANARIGSLMGGLRKRVDALLTKKVTDPSLELSMTTEMRLIVKLIRTNGL